MQMNAYRNGVSALDDAAPDSAPVTPARARRPDEGLKADPGTRWELYRLLADPVRPRLLALVSLHELGVRELAELLREGQPKISRHAAALREAGLVTARRQGTWTLLQLAPGAGTDPVVADAVAAGLASAGDDGTLLRVEDVLHARDVATREFFARTRSAMRVGPPPEMAAYLAAFAPLVPHRRLAVDAGTGDGALLEVLAPVFEKVVALDRADAQLQLAAERVRRRQLTNVTLVQGEVDGPEASAAVRGSGNQGGADAVFASRVLHHAPVPERAFAALVKLARPGRKGERGGAVLVLDYEPHEDQTLRDQEADLWLGFDAADLFRMGKAAGLVDASISRLPGAWQGDGPDRHLGWHLYVGFRGWTARDKDERNQS